MNLTVKLVPFLELIHKLEDRMPLNVFENKCRNIFRTCLSMKFCYAVKNLLMNKFPCKHTKCFLSKIQSESVEIRIYSTGFSRCSFYLSKAFFQQICSSKFHFGLNFDLRIWTDFACKSCAGSQNGTIISKQGEP